MYRNDLSAATAHIHALENELAQREANEKEVVELKELVARLDKKRLPREIKLLDLGMAGAILGVAYFTVIFGLLALVGEGSSLPLGDAVGLPLAEPLIVIALLFAVGAVSLSAFGTSRMAWLPGCLYVIWQLAPFAQVPAETAAIIGAFFAASTFAALGYLFARARTLPLALGATTGVMLLATGVLRAAVLVNDALWTTGISEYRPYPHPPSWLVLYHEGAMPLLTFYIVATGAASLLVAMSCHHVKRKLVVKSWEM